jgi:hypothetical protein
MSGTTDPVAAPTDNAEWARDADARLTQLENPTSQRVGSWVLSTSADGNLIASNVNGGSVVLAKPPAGGETNPDAIVDDVNPSCTVSRVAAFTLPSGGGVITFDGVITAAGGDWTSGKAGFSAITVPVAGTYCIIGVVQLISHPQVVYGGALTVNGSMIAGGRYADESSTGAHHADVSIPVTIVAELKAGDAISLWAWTGGATNVGAGTTNYTQSVPTTLSAFMVTKKG